MSHLLEILVFNECFLLAKVFLTPKRVQMLNMLVPKNTQTQKHTFANTQIHKNMSTVIHIWKVATNLKFIIKNIIVFQPRP